MKEDRKKIEVLMSLLGEAFKENISKGYKKVILSSNDSMNLILQDAKGISYVYKMVLGVLKEEHVEDPEAYSVEFLVRDHLEDMYAKEITEKDVEVAKVSGIGFYGSSELLKEELCYKRMLRIY